MAQGSAKRKTDNYKAIVIIFNLIKMSGETSEKVKGEDDKPKKEEKRYFTCGDCGLNEEYNYFGKQPPFCRAIQFLEPSYVAKDPFSDNRGNNANFLLLGGNCAGCEKMTCQECSVFFSKWLCAECFRVSGNQLPEELLKLKQKSNKTKD